MTQEVDLYETEKKSRGLGGFLLSLGDIIGRHHSTDRDTPLSTRGEATGLLGGVAAWLGFTLPLALALVVVFVPSFLLVVGALSLWDSLRPRPSVQAALQGTNAAVVGLLLATLYHPVWTGAIHAPADVALGLMDFALLAFWKWPPWLVVAVSTLGGHARPSGAETYEIGQGEAVGHR